MFSRLNILSCEEVIDLMYFSARSGQCRTREERDNDPANQDGHFLYIRLKIGLFPYEEKLE